MGVGTKVPEAGNRLHQHESKQGSKKSSELSFEKSPLLLVRLRWFCCFGQAEEVLPRVGAGERRGEECWPETQTSSGTGCFFRLNHQYIGTAVAISTSPMAASRGRLKMVLTNKPAQNRTMMAGITG